MSAFSEVWPQPLPRPNGKKKNKTVRLYQQVRGFKSESAASQPDNRAWQRRHKLNIKHPGRTKSLKTQHTPTKPTMFFPAAFVVKGDKTEKWISVIWLCKHRNFSGETTHTQKKNPHLFWTNSYLCAHWQPVSCNRGKCSKRVLQALIIH